MRYRPQFTLRQLLVVVSFAAVAAALVAATTVQDIRARRKAIALVESLGERQDLPLTPSHGSISSSGDLPT